MFSRLRTAVVLVSVAAALTSCAEVVDGQGQLAAVANADLQVVGDSKSKFDTTVKNALADVISFWKVQYPKIARGQQLPDIKGGLYSVDGLPVIQTRTAPAEAMRNACLQRQPTFVVDNAAYCRLDDSIIWDRNANHLVAKLQAEYGDVFVALVFAHEFGHALSQRLGVFDNNPATILTESQADCAAGAWASTVLNNKSPHFRGTPQQLDDALEGFLNVRDQTPESPADISHGNGFDRLSAVADGITKGPAFCFGDKYFDRTFTERAFTTDADRLRGGNETLEEVLDPSPPQKDGSGGGGLQPDLNRFWKQAATSIGKQWKDVQIKQAGKPPCGESSASTEFAYCRTDNTVYYSDAIANSAYYSLPDVEVDRSTGNVSLLFKQPADFSLGTLFAIGWGMAVRHQLFARTLDDKAALLAAVCYSGAYAKDINVVENDGKHSFTLSPPDLDEAASAMLQVVGTDRAFGSRDTTGLDRIQSFVKGYAGGLSAC